MVNSKDDWYWFCHYIGMLRTIWIHHVRQQELKWFYHNLLFLLRVICPCLHSCSWFISSQVCCNFFCMLHTVIHNKENAINTGYISYPGIEVSKSRSNNLGLRKYLGCLKHVLKGLNSSQGFVGPYFYNHLKVFEAMSKERSWKLNAICIHKLRKMK